MDSGQRAVLVPPSFAHRQEESCKNSGQEVDKQGVKEKLDVFVRKERALFRNDGQMEDSRDTAASWASKDSPSEGKEESHFQI